MSWNCEWRQNRWRRVHLSVSVHSAKTRLRSSHTNQRTLHAIGTCNMEDLISSKSTDVETTMRIGVNQHKPLPMGVITPVFAPCLGIFRILYGRRRSRLPNRYEVPPAHIYLNSDKAEMLSSHPTNSHLRLELAWAENKDIR